MKRLLARSLLNITGLAGDEGFEPPIVEPESTALPLGQSPSVIRCHCLSARLYKMLSFRASIASIDKITVFNSIRVVSLCWPSYGVDAKRAEPNY